MSFLFKDREGQTPLPPELQKGLKIKTIQTVGELDEYEEHSIAQGISWLSEQKNDPNTYQFWIKLHKKLFESVWEWAGQIRMHELQNPDFASPLEIWRQLDILEKDLSFWISSSSFSQDEIAARFHERIETIHPFANGNGRFGRILTEQICKFHGYKIPTWGARYSNEPVVRRKNYIAALTSARRQGQYADLIAFMFT